MNNTPKHPDVVKEMQNVMADGGDTQKEKMHSLAEYLDEKYPSVPDIEGETTREEETMDQDEVNAEDVENDDENNEDNDPSVPTDLLELHVALEDADVSPEEFKEAFGS